jgi:hypothetical protein
MKRSTSRVVGIMIRGRIAPFFTPQKDSMTTLILYIITGCAVAYWLRYHAISEKESQDDDTTDKEKEEAYRNIRR